MPLPYSERASIHPPHFFPCYPQARQSFQQRQSLRPLPQRPQSQLCDEERMSYNARAVQLLSRNSPVARTEVVNPDGCVGENHSPLALRRGIFSNSGIVPPNAANLRALSRSIKPQ